MWAGLALGLYVLVISLSGSAIVFRQELNRALCQRDGYVCEPPFVTWVARLHGELLGGWTGMMWNGVGAIAVAVMCLTGAVLWWTGKGGWWQRVSIRRNSSRRRLFRDLHNMLGFWFFLLLVLWASTGIYFAFPDIINLPTSWLEDEGSATTASLFMQHSIAALTNLHFGRTYGLFVKILWVVLGLVPVVLFVTGALMWWKGQGQPPAQN